MLQGGGLLERSCRLEYCCVIIRPYKSKYPPALPVDTYFFLQWGVQPQMMFFERDYPDADSDLARSLFKATVPAMLKVFREYLSE